MGTMLHIYGPYIVNVLDILVLTVIFYRLILVIKGTRAIQVVVGILFVLGLTVVARNVLHLKALSWLLEKFWLAAAIIFAVIFQTEIRNVFAQVGGRLWNSKSQTQDSYVADIVETAEDLSASMMGGLIAIENEIGLKNYTETGVSLNADISKELLLSIFKNKSAPLHDGAVIIFNGKVSAAGCLLPLSHNTNVKIFGTRHRAALGLSEVTDAIIVVVSEETGRISIAYEGNLHSNKSASELKEIINSKGEVLTSK
ncbi:membrane protein [Endomicrobiia bacterium]|nr:membrane protein [Endomicrobiia bacterium]GHT64497.1 membrane protein [Endomicrobiia bacterium]GHT69150.1 membrane protein [Endomicrobiia bacterium]GHT73160.1 membrane protein [Endomicrobiia bacterium]